MWQRAITGSSGGGGNIKSGDEGSITTANTELEINTGVSNLKRFVVQCNSGTSLYTITWDKNATINSGGTNYYGMVKFYQSISSSAGATQVVLPSDSITANSMFDYYTSAMGVSPLTATVDTTATPPTLTLTFMAQASDLSVKVKVF